MVWLLIFEGTKFSCISLCFLSMTIYEGLYVWCIRYNICNAGFRFNLLAKRVHKGVNKGGRVSNSHSTLHKHTA